MNNELKKFTYQDIISIIFVIAAICNIIACDKEKEYIISKDKKDKEIANTIYILVIVVFIILYIYFIKVNYKEYNNCNIYEKNKDLIRLYGSIFFLIGALCFLYYRINDKNDIQSIVEI